MEITLGRREFALGAAAAAAALAGGSARAAQPPQTLAELAGACTRACEECLSHCLASLRSGETMLAACAQLVHEMIPTCTALGRLVAAQSRHLAAFGAVCAALCDDCEAECRKHAEMHAACRACADACLALKNAIRA